MSLHDNLVTLMVSTGQILARGDLRCDMHSLIAPSIRIKPSAANAPRQQNNSAHSASLRLCVKNKTTTK